MIIREIQKEDNEQVAAVIRQVLIELNVPKVGTAYLILNWILCLKPTKM